MERAKDTSIAMEARAFRAYPHRTYLRKLKLKTRDFVIMILLPLLAIGFVFFNHQLKPPPPEQIILSMTDSPATSQAVSWYSNEKYHGRVMCDGRKITAQCVEIREGEYYRYKAIIDGLAPATTYSYQVGNNWVHSEENTFQTASSGHASFLYMGDIQYQIRDEGYAAWKALLNSAYADHSNVNFGIFGGDMVEHSGDTQDWSTFFDGATSTFSTIPMATVPGNHEISVLPYTYMRMFPLPQNGPQGALGEVYSFDYGDVHVTALNSGLFMEERIRELGETSWEKLMGEVNRWLKNDLKNTSAKYKIVVMHHPAYPVEEDDAIYEKIRENWASIYASQGADMVFCGHQHVYMRTKKLNGVTYLMSNAGEKTSYYYKEGMPLPAYAKKIITQGSTYQVISTSDEGLTVKCYNTAGKQIDYFILRATTAKRPFLSGT